jgi:hypothetical protein
MNKTNKQTKQTNKSHSTLNLSHSTRLDSRMTASTRYSTISLDAIVNFVFFAYNNLFDHLKNQKIKRETIDIFWFDDLTRTLRKTSDKLLKYYAMIEEKCDTLYNVEILLDSTKKLVFYQICHLTNISHEYFSRWFSRIFLTNISHEYFSRIFFTNIFHEYFSRIFFTNILYLRLALLF